VTRVEVVSGEQPGGEARHPAASRHYSDAGTSDHSIDSSIVRTTPVDLDEDGTRHDDVVTTTLGGTKERSDTLGSF
jgi:hypothetical protein